MDALAASCDCGGSGLGPCRSLPLAGLGSGGLEQGGPRGGQSRGCRSIPRSPVGAEPCACLIVSRACFSAFSMEAETCLHQPSLNLPCRSGSEGLWSWGCHLPQSPGGGWPFQGPHLRVAPFWGWSLGDMQTGSPGVTIPRSMRPGVPVGSLASQPWCSARQLGVFNEPQRRGGSGRAQRPWAPAGVGWGTAAGSGMPSRPHGTGSTCLCHHGESGCPLIKPPAAPPGACHMGVLEA